MTLMTVRRLAADIMNVGRSRIRISPDGLKEAEGALTRADVRGLIGKGIVTKTKKSGRTKKPGRTRKGAGSRKGVRSDKKENWMKKVRSQRKLLVELIEKEALSKSEKRAIYGKVKSGIFRNKRAMLLYLKDNDFIPKDFEQGKEKPAETPKKAKKVQKKQARKRGRTAKKPAKKQGESK